MADNIWNRELLLWKKRKESKPLESLLWAKETFNKKKKKTLYPVPNHPRYPQEEEPKEIHKDRQRLKRFAFLLEGYEASFKQNFTIPF